MKKPCNILNYNKGTNCTLIERETASLFKNRHRMGTNRTYPFGGKETKMSYIYKRYKSYKVAPIWLNLQYRRYKIAPIS